MKPRQVFVREATGLVREASLLGVFAFAGSAMSVITGWWNFTWIGAAVPGGELGIATGLAALLLIFPAMIYAMISSAFPRSGSEYVFATRVLHPAIGFMVSWYMTFVMVSSIGLVAAVSTVGSIQAILGVYGSVYNNATLFGWAAALGNVNVNTVVSLVVIAITGAFAALDIRRFYQFMVAGLVICYLGLFLSFGAMLMSNPADFANALNSSLAMPDLYQTVIANASKAGLVSSISWSLTLGPMLAYGFVNLGGWWNPAVVGGEVKNPHKNLPLATIGALLVNAVLYVIFFELVYHAFGFPFVSALGFSGANPTDIALNVPFLIAVLVKDNPILLFLVCLGFLMGPIWLIPGFLAFGSRNMFAWSFDKLAPEKLSELSERFRGPTYATLVGVVFAVFFLLLWNYTPIYAYYANISFIEMIVLAIVMIAAVVFPWRRKGIFDQSPSLVTKKLGGIPLISIIGAVGAIVFLYMAYEQASFPGIFGALGFASVGFVVGVCLLAIVLYYASLAYHKGRGIDIRLAYNEIPPE